VIDTSVVATGYPWQSWNGLTIPPAVLARADEVISETKRAV